jgi:hypothetical protein
MCQLAIDIIQDLKQQQQQTQQSLLKHGCARAQNVQLRL